MDFRWNAWNIEHVERHGVDLEEAEDVVANAAPPFPLSRSDDKWLVWGRGRGDRLLQVVFLLDEDDTVFIIHARPLTEGEKRRFRRWQRK
jgi:uncharacterized DUF497 family protein